MKLLDKIQNREQYKNKYLELRLDFANLRQTFTGFSPVQEYRRSYFHFNILIQEVRRPKGPFARRSFVAIMQPDIDKFLPMFDHFDLTREQKIEYIHILWKATGAFAYRAFGLDPVQLACNNKDGKVGAQGASLLGSKNSTLQRAFDCLESNTE